MGALISIHARLLLHQVLAQVEVGSTIECSCGLPIVFFFTLGLAILRLKVAVISALSLFFRPVLACNSSGTS